MRKMIYYIQITHFTQTVSISTGGDRSVSFSMDDSAGHYRWFKVAVLFLFQKTLQFGSLARLLTSKQKEFF